jgi:hypothetical protein
MTTYGLGETVRVDIPDPDDPDHKYHGKVGVIKAVYADDLGLLTGNPEDDSLYTVVFDEDDLGTMDFRYQDLESV